MIAGIRMYNMCAICCNQDELEFRGGGGVSALMLAGKSEKSNGGCMPCRRNVASGCPSSNGCLLPRKRRIWLLFGTLGCMLLVPSSCNQ